MSDRNWDAELKKIDRQLESVSDEAMFPTKTAKGPQAKAQVAEVQKTTSTWGVFLRLALTVALGVAWSSGRTAPAAAWGWRAISAP